MKVTNESKALQGVYTKTGVAWIKPGETKPVDLTEEGKKLAKRLPFLKFAGSENAEEAPSPSSTDEPKTVIEALAMATASDVPFMTFKAAASKLLGDKTPAKKDDIVAALEELATQP